MAKYKVLTPMYKNSDKKVYEIGEQIEVSDDEAPIMIQEGRIEANKKESTNTKKEK